MKEQRVKQKFEELSTRVNKSFKIGGLVGATTCDSYRRVTDEMGVGALKYIMPELIDDKHFYWFEALEKITGLKTQGKNNPEKALNWENWWLMKENILEEKTT